LFAVYVDNVFECVSDYGLGYLIKWYCMRFFMHVVGGGAYEARGLVPPQNVGPGGTL